MYQYKFSVIIPVYNAEDYLEETLQSVINQSIGFKDHIQMILVDDGSTDRSEEICRKYVSVYPENITYVRQENAGVSAARNKGLEYIQGEFVNFLDSDDKWEIHAFSHVADFFSYYGEAADVAACRIRYFEQRENYHTLDYKFESTKLVDILKSYTMIQLSMATTFVRATALKGKSFDPRIRYGEDCILINQIILEKCKYGIIRESLYLYRMRNTGGSAMQNTTRVKSFYQETEDLVFNRLLEISKEKFGRIIEYIQFLVMYDTKWRLRLPIPAGVLSPDEEQTYKNGLVRILKQIDDRFIKEQKDCTSAQLKMALDIKYGKDISEDLKYDKGLLSFQDINLMRLPKRRMFYIDFIRIENKEVHITGHSIYWLPDSMYRIAFIDQKHQKYYVDFFDIPQKDRIGIFGPYDKQRGYHVTIPLKKVLKLQVIFEYKAEKPCTLLLNYGKFTGLTTIMSSSYTTIGKYILNCVGEKKLLLRRMTKENYHESEKAYCRELREKKQNTALFYRYALRLFKKKQKKKIWIISDRINLARDNGEALFRYLSTIDTKDILPCFDISSESVDYERLKAFGKVLPHDSFQYKLHFLAADKIISAQIDEYVINAFAGLRNYMSNLYHFDIVFLQHGLTKDDLSGWLNHFDKNISLFVTGAKPEYNSIINGNYFYTDKQVKLTGFPRFDNLTGGQTKKQLIILPTWRKALANSIDPSTGKRIYNPNFRNTDYFKFYHGLIHDKRLLDCMKKHGYTGKFCLHINHMEQLGDFTGNDIIHIQNEELNYQKEFLENALMLTDYSSVAFDFAYMKKEVVYAQFDREQFFEEQTYDEGYFDYERDGFGPVCYTYEDTVLKLIEAIERDAKMEPEYEKRVEAFYYKTDQKNCERVYNAIRNISK